MYAHFDTSQNNTFFQKINVAKIKVPVRKYIVPELRYIKVTDKRTDTSRFGVFRTSVSNFVQLQLPNDISLEKIMNDCLSDPKGSREIVMVISHLTVKNKPFEKWDKSAQGVFERRKALLCFKAKLYLKNGAGYLPFIKIDTTLVPDESLTRVALNLADQVAEIISAKIRQGFTDRKFERRALLTAAQVDSLTKPAIHLPLNYSADTGYYQTYNDFLKGNITPVAFRLEKIADGCFAVYEKHKDGSETLLRTPWGLKTGNGNYIMQYDLYFPIYQYNQALYWKGIYKFEENHLFVPVGFGVRGYVASGWESVTLNQKSLFVPYLLNNDTGKGYE